MQAVNLLPAYARPASRWATIGSDYSPARVARIGGIVAAACAIAIAGLFFYERSVVSDKRAQLADATARLTAVEATAAPLRTAQAASEARGSYVRTIANSRVAWEVALSDLSRILPDQVFLQNMQAQSPTPATTASAPAVAAAPTSFTLTGTAGSQLMVALVLDRLALVPWLSNVTLGSSIEGSGTSGLADQFSISAGFSAPSTGGGAK